MPDILSLIRDLRFSSFLIKNFLLIFLIHYSVTSQEIAISQWHNSLVFAARQITNNLSPIAKKF